MRARGGKRSVGGHCKGAAERLGRQDFYGEKKPQEQMENKRYCLSGCPFVKENV